MSRRTGLRGKSQHFRRAALLALLALVVVGSAEVGPLIAPRNVLLYGAQHFADARLPHPTPRGHGSIAGRVTEEDGRPIAGAVIMVSAMDGTIYRASTTADGGYTLANVPAGLYTPMAAKGGYTDAFPANRAHQFVA